jgi:hypothetical protein
MFNEISDVNIFVLALSAIAGAAASLIVGFLHARVKITALQKQFDQKLTEVYFKNARDHIGDLYCPLNKEVSNIYETYRAYSIAAERRKRKTNGALGNDLNNVKNDFSNACNKYCSMIDTIYKKSSDVYLVGSIESNMLNLREVIEISGKEDVEYSSWEKLTDLLFVYILSRPKIAKNVFLFQPFSFKQLRLFSPSAKFFQINTILFSFYLDTIVSAIKSDIKLVTLGQVAK